MSNHRLHSVIILTAVLPHLKCVHTQTSLFYLEEGRSHIQQSDVSGTYPRTTKKAEKGFEQKSLTQKSCPKMNVVYLN